MKVTVFWYVRSCRLETAAYNFTIPDRRKVAGRNLFTRQHGELPKKRFFVYNIFLCT
jgi:hypothetical protein